MLLRAARPTLDEGLAFARYLDETALRQRALELLCAPLFRILTTLAAGDFYIQDMSRWPRLRVLPPLFVRMTKRL